MACFAPNLRGDISRYRDTKADAIVPTTKAPYEPLKTIPTRTNKLASKMALADCLRSNFHLMIAMLKKTAIPMIRYSIITPYSRVLQ